jgi:alkylation response protein AidB-like acyl-CoA dehydrogenase
MDFEWTAAQQDLRLEAREVALEAVARFGRTNDSWIHGYEPVFAQELAARGWIGMTWPRELGGGGRAPIDRFIVFEELISAGAPIAGVWFADRQVGPMLVAHGTPEQRDRFLPRILAGESTWCIGMSEPDAGSDVASLRTSARLDDGCWHIDGQKTWTSLASVADHCYLICRTGPMDGRHSGISEIVVPMDSPGLEVRPITDLAGHKSFCAVHFDDVVVPQGNLVGEEGAAFAQTMRQLEHERGGIDRLVSNRALYLQSLEHPDASLARFAQERAEIETCFRLGRLLVLRETLGQAPPGFSAASKVFCTEHEQRVSAFTSRVFGPETTLWNHTALGLTYAPAYTIMGGTSTVLRNVIAERVLGLPR